MTLELTFVLLAIEILLFAFCYWQDKKPVNLAKPRLLPYRIIMMFLIVMFLATLAHILSVVTGQPIKPRGKMGLN
jgi:hypothetical protein